MFIEMFKEMKQQSDSKVKSDMMTVVQSIKLLFLYVY